MGVKALTLLSYISSLCLIPLIFMRDNPYAYFHARQGFVLFIIQVVGAFVTIIPAVGQLVYGVVLWLVILFSLAGVVAVLFGRAWRLPLVYDLARRI
ncbi:putative Magnetosome MamF-like protein [Magnetofaba australis IT-1]|uniref:MamF-like protein n=1 Tax=Magnetofaba australis IT-1 TaxID=1434232 RepID=W0LP25_9PROT|nr:MamF-like protein [Magnetofaba australis IT-1]OSM08647.1 putative Magnetosome MamF-like protein [Magnetofaba australis IT-1]